MNIGQALDKLKIKDDWDAVLIGDGSGQSWDIPCGWSCVLMERELYAVEVFSGAMNRGTGNIAEIMPYIQALTWYLEELRKRRKFNQTTLRPRKVVILTDSQYVQQKGKDPDKALAKRNRAFWTILSLLERQGLICEWHHIYRDTVDANYFADQVSKAARILFKKEDVIAAVEEKIGTVDNYNPFTKKGGTRGKRKLDT